MRSQIYSYRFAEEILQHEHYEAALSEIMQSIHESPIFIYPGKSARNSRLDIVQQVMNTYFDRRFAVDMRWEYHPLATTIPDSNLRADFRKTFGTVPIQVEVQFGNMSRWYSDIFKFQTAYSQDLVKLAVSIIPMKEMACRIDSNVVNFERAYRELPSAELSITLPILLIGVYPDEDTEIVDVSKCNFPSIGVITGSGTASDNRWRIVNGYLSGIPMEKIGPLSIVGPTAAGPPVEPEE